MYKKLGFDGVQFHDDDAVPELNDLSPAQIRARAKAVKRQLDGAGLVAEFVAPRLWEDPRTIDGAFTANDPKCRRYALDRAKKCIDIANALGTKLIVLWLAREGSYIRESKNPRKCTGLLLDAINKQLQYDKRIRIAIEPKPNEPMDQAYVPTIGHAIAMAYASADPKRVGALVETAHALLAGLDPSDEMAFALYHKKLYSVHLNDQSGLKFDEDKSFGSANLRGAFNQVRVLAEADYGSNGEFVGLDVKAMRTQSAETATKHLANSRATFLHLAKKARTLDKKAEQALAADRDYEGLDRLILEHLMGV